MKITMKRLIKGTDGCQGSSEAGGKDKCFSVYVHALTAGYKDPESCTKVARVHMTPSHAGDEAASRKEGRACPEANAEACSTLRRATHAGIHMKEGSSMKQCETVVSINSSE